MALSLYRGFSTASYLSNKQSFRLADIDVVKRDLLNHIYTRRGERVMMSNFGTSIPDLLFEQLDEKTVQEVRQQLEYVFNYDPRVTLIELNVFAVPELNGIIASAVLQYIELNVVDRFDLHLEFDAQL
jgi:phage baseplate assembly protein W